MKISYNWLKSYISLNMAPQQLSDTLTMLGLEVGSWEETGKLAHSLDKVVVGQVLSAEKHPNADRLRVCKVDVGTEVLDIVCGAPNVTAGQKVPVALVGAVLHPFGADKALKIEKGKIRGEVSMGMICAEDELGLGPDHDGILVLDSKLPVGKPFEETLKLELDAVFEVDITPNRVDAASHYGVARDLGAALKKRVNFPQSDLDPAAFTGNNPIKIQIKDKERCPRYTAIYLSGVTVKDSPEWLQKRLRAVGQRPINNIVDITNFVMLELGQPLHAFDADRLAGNTLIIQTLPKDESFVTLEGTERKLLAGEDLMICDQEKPLCIAGIKGGLNSGVTVETRNILLESAYFHATGVRKTSKRLDLHTDSSFRFARGSDPHMTRPAAIRAAGLIHALAGGKVSLISDEGQTDFPYFPVDFSLSHARMLYGTNIPRATQIAILKALEIRVQETGNRDLLKLEVPPYRVDVKRPQDVMEEILRIYGYNNIPIPATINMSMSYRKDKDTFGLRNKFADYLSATGFYEVMNNSLTSASLSHERSVHMLNPLSEELGILRGSMLMGLLESVQFNQNRQQEDLSIYEFGKTYSKLGSGQYEEKEWLALALTGAESPKNWAAKDRRVSLFSLSKEVERLQAWFKFSGELEEYRDEELDYGLCLKVGDAIVLRYGKVADTWRQQYDLRNEVFYLCADWGLLSKLYFEAPVVFQKIPDYPYMRRDVSMIIDDSTDFNTLQKIISRVEPKLIQKVELHDVYQGKGIPEGKKSYLVSIVLQDPQRTLDDGIADQVSARIFKALEKEAEAEIRKQ